MTRTNFLLRLACGLSLLALLAAPVRAQAESREELEDRIRERFSSMLRSELALSDEQAEVVLPLMTDLEAHKRELNRERRTTAMELQAGMRDGASDAELQEALDRLDELEDEQRGAERAAMAKIDAELNTRQRVKLRFFVQQFRRQIEARLSNRADRLERTRMRQKRSRPGDR